MNLSKLKNRRVFFLRVLIAILAYSFIVYRIGLKGIVELKESITKSLSAQNVFIYLLLIFLMLVVWGLEAAKWRISLSPFKNISFIRSWRSVWYGVVAGQLTPNRIGEPVGRLALIDPDVRGKAGVAAIWCSLMQQMVTVFFGFIGVIWWFFVVGFDLLPKGSHYYFIGTVFLIWVLLIIISIFNLRKISSWIERIGWIKKVLHGERLQIGYNPKVVLIVFAISSLRYILFSTQYVILLSIFGVKASSFDLYAAVSLIYLFSSFIPSFSASEIGIRTSFALWFVGMLHSNDIGITTASILIWLLNIAVPTVIGAWFKWRLG